MIFHQNEDFFQKYGNIKEQTLSFSSFDFNMENKYSKEMP